MPVYRRPYRRRLPKRSRTIPLFAGSDLEGRYYKCWNCGFVCDVERDTLGGSDDTSGDNHTDYHNIAPENPYTNDSASKSLCLDGVVHFHTLMELGPDGEVKTIVHDHITDVTKGCPFCGSTNWRGDY